MPHETNKPHDPGDRTRRPAKEELKADITINATPDEVLQAVIDYRPDQ